MKGLKAGRQEGSLPPFVSSRSFLRRKLAAQFIIYNKIDAWISGQQPFWPLEGKPLGKIANCPEGGGSNAFKGL